MINVPDLVLKKNLSVLKSFDKISVNEVVDIPLKRKTAESSSSTPVQNQERMIPVVAKKSKLVEDEEYNIAISGDNSEENDELDSF